MDMTREQAAAAVATAAAERDSIQANLLDLEASFGKRMLAGATLTGESKRRWEEAAIGLAALWEIFNAYQEVVDQAAGLLAHTRHLSNRELTQISAMLNGASVELVRQRPLGRRDLTETGRADMTLATAVHEMKRAFAVVAGVVAAAEGVWNDTADGLSEISTKLTIARQEFSGLADDELKSALTAAEAELGQLRDVLNSDPLSLWQGGRVDISRLEGLRAQIAALTRQGASLAGLRAEARQRLSAAHSAVAAVTAARKCADAARSAAASKIARNNLPAPPADAADLDGRLATLDKLDAAGRWTRLAAELSALETEAAAATARYRDAEQAASALLGKREELRGLLDAYQAKAVRLGRAEDIELATCYQQARDLLWAAPCDLAIAATAVSHYQQAILARNEGRQPR